jgi:hypothetical protein
MYGSPVSGHVIKLQTYTTHLERWLAQNPALDTLNAAAARALIADMQAALAGK